MKWLDARIVAVGLLAAGLTLGAVALISALSETSAHAAYSYGCAGHLGPGANDDPRPRL